MEIAANPTRNAVALSALGGGAALLLHVPLPWMVGPMLAIAMSKMCRLPVRPPRGGRETGQLIIGTAIGLAFTPNVVHQVANTIGLMLLAGSTAILIGFLSAFAVARMAGVDRKTAFFACVPGGAAEMVSLGERYGAAADFIAMAQSLRMMLVVLIVPPLFTWYGVSGSMAYEPAHVNVDIPGLAMLFLASGLAGLALRHMDGPTPWMLGPLLCSVAVTASGHTLSAMPGLLSGVGQCLIGCALGSRFERDFLIKAPRLLCAAAIGFLVTLMLSALLGSLLGLLNHIAIPSMILATAPGGIAEMSITAKILQLGVPLVTAFHVTRLLMLLTMTSQVYRLCMYWAGRKAAIK